jgi:hypothetical protein
MGFGDDGAFFGAAPSSLPHGDAVYVRVQTSPTGEIVAEQPSGMLLWLDEHSVVKQKLSLVGRTGPYGTLMSVFQWSLLTDSQALAVVNILDTKGRWSTAIVRLPLLSNRYEVLHLIDPAKPGAILYRSGIPALARVGHAGYFLALEEERVGLYRVVADERPRLLSVLPKFAPEVLRELPRDQGMEQTPDLLRLLEHPGLPAGLFGTADALFLLHRVDGTAQCSGSWKLTRLDPRNGKVLGGQLLPTNAHHLTVAPGEHDWAFIEKGAVEEIGHQSIGTVLLVPTLLIEGKPVSTKTVCDG